MKFFPFCLALFILLAITGCGRTAQQPLPPLPIAGTWVELKELPSGEKQTAGQIVLSRELVVITSEKVSLSQAVEAVSLNQTTGAGSLTLASKDIVIIAPTKVVIETGTGAELVDCLQVTLKSTKGDHSMRVFDDEGAALAVFASKKMAAERAERKQVSAPIAADAEKSSASSQLTGADRAFRVVVEAAAPDFLNDTDALIAVYASLNKEQLRDRQVILSDAYRRRIHQDIIVARHARSDQRDALLAKIDQKRRQLATFESSFTRWLDR